MLSDTLRAGADGFLKKPVQKEEFLESLRQLHAGETPLAEEARQWVFRHFRDHGPKTFLADTLTEREREVLVWAGEGLTDAAIAKNSG